MPNPNAQQQAPRQARPHSMSQIELPGQNLTLNETLRVMDVAREMRDQRETAEEMFRRDDARTNLRNKLVRAARLSGDNVSEAEIEAAIDQYLATLHTYEDPQPGLKSLIAHLWIWRNRMLWSAAALAATGGLLWSLFA
ncbi:hypothetical protein Pla52o_27080 [Novipirellula galeiformis]|uniref:Uncharacterized protein n=1 Tax=Novipirellula galeiformis TaxID=2528004 RepID=A0A5C6CE52_9BACT|nr:DUF6384 family protein [Novipirellula galeiformis]TWU23173.1 hypothetical protein Pla52o_27080 [Novipirellula galeiformis]